MNFVLQPWQLLVFILASWLQRQQQQIIEFQNEQIKTCLLAHGKKRLRLTDDQRRRLAVQGKALGRKALNEITTIVTPDTILRWHRELVVARREYPQKQRRKPGRPRISEEVTQLILRMARENSTWGYNRIQGALANLGFKVSDTTVGNVLKANGIEPAPERKRKMSWKTFLKAHWDVLAAVDFTTVDVWNKRELAIFYLLFAIQFATRGVRFAAAMFSRMDAWLKQIPRNLTDSINGFLNRTRYLLMDRVTMYCDGFCRILEQEQSESLRLPPNSLNLFFLNDRGEDSPRTAPTVFIDRHRLERNPQDLANQWIDPGEDLGRPDGEILCHERLGENLHYDHRRAA